MKRAIGEYHRENRERAEMIRELNSINPNGATFLTYNRLIGQTNKKINKQNKINKIMSSS